MAGGYDQSRIHTEVLGSIVEGRRSDHADVDDAHAALARHVKHGSDDARGTQAAVVGDDHLRPTVGLKVCNYGMNELAEGRFGKVPFGVAADIVFAQDLWVYWHNKNPPCFALLASACA
ncbi:MAG: hypothetical protein DDT37_01769 [Firmicutes bacterium]|nr:hypothetical protein [candidate division NPL-UPA2 bacterium]